MYQKNDIIEDLKKDLSTIKSFSPKKTLCTLIFDNNGETYTLKKEIRSLLLKTSNKFIESLNTDFFVHDIILTGSLSNYNWSKYSDVDLHIVVDYEDFKDIEKLPETYFTIVKDFFKLKSKEWNDSTNIKIKNHDVEIYIQDVNEKHVSTGVYSILNDEWIIEPKKPKEKINIDVDYILDKSKTYIDEIDKIFDLSKEGVDVSNNIETIMTKLKKSRKSGLDSGGEYSYENLTFKLLRRNGYIKKLMNIKNKNLSKKLSITQ